MKSKQQLERSIEVNRKVGKWTFSIADGFGSVGKLLTLSAMVVLIIGSLAALVTDVCQGNIERNKKRLRDINNNNNNK